MALEETGRMMLSDEILPLLMDVADEVILPRFRSLTTNDVEEKAPGEVVTVADREAEELIAARLRNLLPGVPVVGEEAVAANPALLSAIGDADACWLVDPLDGTANFIEGRATFAVMVALVRHGETVGSWIWRPHDRVGYAAERGGGAWRNGVRLSTSPASSDVGRLRGAVLTRFLDADERAMVEAAIPRFESVAPGHHCAGVEYPLIAEGDQDFVVFKRMLPWDHAAGILLLEEAGGVARRWNGTPYAPSQHRTGILAATDDACWKLVRETLGLT